MNDLIHGARTDLGRGWAVRDDFQIKNIVTATRVTTVILSDVLPQRFSHGGGRHKWPVRRRGAHACASDGSRGGFTVTSAGKSVM